MCVCVSGRACTSPQASPLRLIDERTRIWKNEVAEFRSNAFRPRSSCMLKLLAQPAKAGYFCRGHDSDERSYRFILSIGEYTRDVRWREVRERRVAEQCAQDAY